MRQIFVCLNLKHRIDQPIRTLHSNTNRAQKRCYLFLVLPVSAWTDRCRNTGAQPHVKTKVKHLVNCASELERCSSGIGYKNAS